jgi:putative DNA primase/helicase
MTTGPRDPALRASDVKPRAVTWLWWPFVPLGKLTAIAGQMGQAKSLWTVWLAAGVTRGEGLNLKRPGGVLILTAEDDPEDTTVPRLIAAGADRERLLLPPDFTLDAAKLARHCDELGDVRLVVVDPLSAYLGDKVDSWKNQHVRRALDPVRRLAQERAMAVVIVQHLNRRGDTADALARIADSQGIPALARSVLIWGPSPTDPDGDQGSLKVLTRAKMNLARGNASAAFRIEEAVIVDGIRAPRLTHLGESDARAEDVTADQATRTQTAAAMQFVRDQLAAGPQEAEAMKAAAAAADITSKCLRVARERLVHSYRPGGNQGPYVWELRRALTDAQGNHELTTLNGKGIQGHSGAFTPVDALVPVDALDLQALLVAFAAGASDGGHGDRTDDELQALVDADRHR